MSIPTKFDHDLAEVESAAACVILSLRTLRHCSARVSQYDLDKMSRTLRERLQAFNDLVIDLANTQP
jgi:hypothetical protein